MLRNCGFEVDFSWEIAASYWIAILRGNLGRLLPRGLAAKFLSFRFFEHGLKLYYSENRLHNPNRKNLSRTLPIFKINKINSNLVIWYTLAFESLAALSLYISRQVSDSSQLAAGSPETSGLPIHRSRQHHGGLSGKCQNSTNGTGNLGARQNRSDGHISNIRFNIRSKHSPPPSLATSRLDPHPPADRPYNIL
ncbi:phage protein [Pseudomonas phage R12]|uniref:Phage protein n=1 Tax=Pseudomonas phage R12 TaxID=2562635 RepID=A0A455XAL7_9CAUD|nr:phage protein [Pseudomonas phage R12]BBJ26650.1 phage protein [Pseudomonas phage R12]